MKENDDLSLQNGHGSCPHSNDCIRLFDEIEDYKISSVALSRRTEASWQEETTLVYLAAHIERCNHCGSVHSLLRTRREHQRKLVRTILHEGENVVPSTTNMILSALAREVDEQAMNRTDNRDQKSSDELEKVSSPLALESVSQRQQKNQRQRGLYIFSWLVAAIVVLASLGTVSQIVWNRNQSPPVTQSSTPEVSLEETEKQTLETEVTPPSLEKASEWSSVLVAHIEQEQAQQRLLVENYDTFQQQSQVLAHRCCAIETDVGEIANNGWNFVYHFYDGKQTTYHLASGEKYVVDGKGSNAVWSTNDKQLIINSDAGIVRIETEYENVQDTLSLKIDADQLAFIGRDQYLYYEQIVDSETKNLSRINLITGNNEQVVQGASITTDFWLSKDQNMIYYTKVVEGTRDIFRLDQNGTEVLLRKNATPIGYASDFSLMVVRPEEDHFSLLKLGNENASDRVVIDNVLPKASSLCFGDIPSDGVPICDDSLALSATGKQIVVGGTMHDGTYQVWLIDLQKGLSSVEERQPLFHLPTRAETSIKLIGWDRIQVAV